MPHYKYLIVGGGMTADAAVQGIRETDGEGQIGLISEEADSPYDRPPLSKGLWKDKPLDSIWRDTRRLKAELHLECRAQTLDSEHKRVTDNRGNSYTYDKLLLATGGRPRRLPFGGDDIMYFRTVEDYRRLRALADRGRRFAVIGGGFIGSEIAAALALQQKQVLLLFPGHGIGDRIFPQALSDFLNDYYRQKGVEVLAGESVTGLAKRGEQFVLSTSRRRDLEVDAVVAGVGLEPNLELAQQAGLRVENGIVVDEFLRTSSPDIYAAGDVAAFFNPALGKRIRVEHEDNANTMGRLAGRNMAGSPRRYEHLPFFYSDLFDLGYEAVGELDARLGPIAVWKEPLREGVVYYQQGGRVRGVLLWNVWGQVDAARQLIADGRQFRPEDLKEDLLKAA
jgi:3-phenylpropionate/trans-cinnamate dioxygenase ferredoxin reductase component